MRNPIEFVSDLYDYNLQYYRWFMHRRLLFSEITADDVKNSVKYDFLANKDYENVGKLITQTTLTGVSAGIGLGALQYGIDTTARNVKANKAFTKSLGVLAVASKLFLIIIIIKIDLTIFFLFKKLLLELHMVVL
jgi:hypothetical protein